jgi:peptidyl-prolyl cis-trans isomerase D
MALKALRDGAAGGILKYFLFGLLVMAVGGLVLMDVGGFFRGGMGNANVANIGKETLTISEFDRNVRRSISRFGMTQENAYRMGLIDQILGSEIRSRMLQQVSADTGLHVDNMRVARQIKQMVEPIALQQGMGVTETLEQLLRNQGMSEREFIASLQGEMSSNLVTSAIQNGFSEISDSMARDIYKVQSETRNITYVPFMDDDIKLESTPEDAQLESLYNAMREQYAIPETRKLKILEIDDKALRETIAVSDEEVRQTYEDNISSYSLPETKTLEQALFIKEEDAKAALQEFNGGKSLEQAVLSATGSKTAYLGEQTLEVTSLIDELKNAVAPVNNAGQIVGPLKTPLGWSLVLVKDIKPASVESFESVKDSIKTELEQSRMSDEIYNLANSVDEQFASGADIAAVQEIVKLDVIDLPEIDQMGATKDDKNVFKGIESYKSIVLDAGFMQLQEGETSPVTETDDGRFIAVNVVSVTPKSYTPFDQVKPELLKKWVSDEKRLENRKRVKDAYDAMNTKKQNLSAMASANGKSPRALTSISRDGDLKKPLTARAVHNLFEAGLNAPIIIDIDGGVAIASVDSYAWPEKIDAEALKAVRDSQIQNMQSEALVVYLQSKQDDYNVSVNRALLNRIYGSTPTDEDLAP